MNDGIWTYEWQGGRQLKRISSEGTAVSFKYDHNGMRTQKVVEASWYPETTNYTLNGKLVTHMTVDYTDFDEVAQQDKLHFFYDSESRPAKVSYNGIIYTYLHNLQGDIVGLLDNADTLVVEYKYDARGKLLSTTGMMADTLGKRNPFRYRGYVYDEETGLYYLRSRYYRPECGRFVNADEFIGIQTDIASHNTYAYCRNQCVNSADVTGLFVVVITAGLEDAVLSLDQSAMSVEDHIGCNCINDIIMGGIIPMIGPKNGYSSGYNSSGDLYEGWYDSDGNIKRVRHHSNHKNPKTHPKNPHDHKGKKDKNGKPTIDHEAEDPDSNYETPKSEKENGTDKVVYGVAAAYILYKGAKILIGIFSFPVTGGLSLIPALAP